MALISGIQAAKAFHAEQIDCYTDSLLSKNLLNGWKTKAPGLKVLVRLARGLIEGDKNINVHHIPRKEIRKIVGH
tara:strand:- start:897 stop:1121 length:225 start_codon:yes stop_codon:yes gene_type:complete